MSCGLFSSPLAIGIYCLIALILLWPLVHVVVRRLRPRPAHEVHHGHAHPLVELAEELASSSEDLTEAESVLTRAEREVERGDDRRDPADRPSGPPPSSSTRCAGRRAGERVPADPVPRIPSHERF